MDVAVKVMQHDARTANKIANEVELIMMVGGWVGLRAVLQCPGRRSDVRGVESQGPQLPWGLKTKRGWKGCVQF
jgi:hypothetical protein